MIFVCSSRRRHTRCALVTGVQTCALPIWIRLREVRIVPDVEAEIVAALNAIRARYDYVFTIGGIGPTHDDITVDAVAKALGVGVIVHSDARAILERYYTARGGELTEARLCIARTDRKSSRLNSS